MDKTLAFTRLSKVPPLSHWPNRPAPFRWEASQVIAHIRRVAQTDLAQATKLFQKAAKARVILFDRAHLTWSGNQAWKKT